MKRPISIVLATLLCLLVLSVSDCVLASSGVLRFGSRGEEVRLLQQQLNERGYLDHQPTGYFGPLTTQAVFGFQLDYCLKVDGMVGPQTLEALRNNGEELPPADDPETDNKPVEVPETGVYLDWFSEAQYIFKEGDVALITDVDTRLSFKIMRTFGHEHADVETLTAEDSEVVKDIWGGWSWERRAVIITVNDRHVAASMTAMPHAGRDGEPALKTIASRSGGYGRGANLDRIKGNDMDGVMCLHFKNSNLHKNDKPEPRHQAMIKKAAGL